MSRLSDRKLMNNPRAALSRFTQDAATGQVEDSLLELVRVRASQINGCGPCLTAHWKAALALGERADRLATLSTWPESDWFTDRGKAALLWAEAVTNVAVDRIDDATWDAVREQFDEPEMVELTMTVITINSFNRFNIAFRNQPTKFEVPATQK